MTDNIEIWTDGSWDSKSKNGGWCYIIKYFDGNENVDSSFQTKTTNNRMELLAIIKALDFLTEDSDENFKLTIYSDSDYVINGISGWYKKWRDNGWVTAKGFKIANKDLWLRLIDHNENEKLSITWNCVKSHSGITDNDRCDELARQSMNSLPKPILEKTEPKVKQNMNKKRKEKIKKEIKREKKELKSSQPVDFDEGEKYEILLFIKRELENFGIDVKMFYMTDTISLIDLDIKYNPTTNIMIHNNREIDIDFCNFILFINDLKKK